MTTTRHPTTQGKRDKSPNHVGFSPFNRFFFPSSARKELCNSSSAQPLPVRPNKWLHQNARASPSSAPSQRMSLKVFYRTKGLLHSFFFPFCFWLLVYSIGGFCERSPFSNLHCDLKEGIARLDGSFFFLNI